MEINNLNTNETKFVSKLLTAKEVAQRLGLKNEDTLAVWRTKKRHGLQYVKIGRNVRYRESDVEQFIRKNLYGGNQNDNS